ncbi:MAG: thiamine pyrophosphate-binding protein [Pigmentiphaga sp.]|uniref:thiamine pyrophosphate-binding protein n=1 Tax=Pigmentiphaga sp. TaxID=1977564 RepID=UPI0029B77616|nr:thiamine pyrophosphate-binding protein [Pigmentiphaga sp.]MDX3905748.1 thiamine pyrophosphate-binding protein [Pigmentiphaga sp.]
MQERMKVSEWLASEIKQSDITHVFFVEAILRNTLLALVRQGVKPILAHSEAAAAYMADGYSRIARKPGICMSQSVGAANLAAGLQDAWLGKGQVLAITGRKPQAHQFRNAYQEIDHRKAFSATAKISLHAESPEMVPRVLAQAWRALHDGKMQPVHIDVEGLMGEHVENGEVEPVQSPLLAQIRFEVQRPSDERARECAERVLAARKVVIVAGYEAAYCRVGTLVLELARALQAPVATTVGAKALIPTDDPLNIGTVGSYGMAVTNEVVHEADVVIAIGCQLSDQNTHGWRVIRPGQTVVQLDRCLDDIGKSYLKTVALVGDLRSSITALGKAVAAHGAERDAAFAHEAANRMQAWRHTARELTESNSHPIRVERIIHEICRALPEDGILVADTGYSAIWSSVYAGLNGTRQEYLRAAGSLGWAFPAALGAKCAAGGRKVVCFAGDGGFYYHVAEIETALRNDIPLVVVVNNNSGFGQDSVNMYAKGMSREDVHLLAGFDPVSVAAVAKGFGANGMRVTRPEDLRPAIEAALQSNTLTIVEVTTPIDMAAPEAWAPPG